MIITLQDALDGLAFMEHTPNAVGERIIDALTEKPMVRDDLVEKVGVPRTTVYDELKKLMLAGRVYRYQVSAATRQRGRPKVMFSLTGDETQEGDA